MILICLIQCRCLYGNKGKNIVVKEFVIVCKKKIRFDGQCLGAD